MLKPQKYDQPSGVDPSEEFNKLGIEEQVEKGNGSHSVYSRREIIGLKNKKH